MSSDTATNLTPLVDLCREIGSRVPVWTQGTGGNLSWKDGGKLWIKASGIRLDAVRPGQGLAAVDLDRLEAGLNGAGISAGAAKAAARLPTDAEEQAYLSALSGAADAKGPRPSMETIVHAQLPAPFVVHMHSLPALLMAHEHVRDARRLAQWWPAAWRDQVAQLPAIRPGLGLGWAVARHAGAKALILQNHGIALQMTSPSELIAWAAVEMDFCHAFGYARLAALLVAADPLGEARVAFRQPMPLRFYFPDTAVFLERLAKQLTPQAGETYVHDGSDRDLGEIWLAQQVLHGERPELAGLPKAIVDSVASLPTEKFRIAATKSAS